MSNVDSRGRGPVAPNEGTDRVAQLEEEVIALEGAVEYLDDEVKALRYALSTVVTGVWGVPDEDRYPSIAFAVRTLYPEIERLEDGRELRGARRMPWQRPARRWSSYGSLAELKARAASHGVKTVWKTREGLIRAMWRAGVSPAGVNQ